MKHDPSSYSHQLAQKKKKKKAYRGTVINKVKRAGKMADVMLPGNVSLTMLKYPV